MPLVYFQTNFKDSELPGDFEVWLSAKVGEVLGKPVERISAQVTPGVRMCRKGINDGPMCMIQIHSIGVFDEERNPTYTPKLAGAIKEKLNIPNGDRIVIHYFPVEGYQVGYGQ